METFAQGAHSIQEDGLLISHANTNILHVNFNAWPEYINYYYTLWLWLHHHYKHILSVHTKKIVINILYYSIMEGDYPMVLYGSSYIHT